MSFPILWCWLCKSAYSHLLPHLFAFVFLVFNKLLLNGILTSTAYLRRPGSNLLILAFTLCAFLKGKKDGDWTAYRNIQKGYLATGPSSSKYSRTCELSSHTDVRMQNRAVADFNKKGMLKEGPLCRADARSLSSRGLIDILRICFWSGIKPTELCNKVTWPFELVISAVTRVWYNSAMKVKVFL